MMVRVNKKISSGKAVKYAALSTGTISHVWYDDDSAGGAKRQNRIRLTREKPITKSSDRFDA
jgi:hypothetical protein